MSDLQTQVLGLLYAALSPLSVADLTRLTEAPEAEVRSSLELLRGIGSAEVSPGRGWVPTLAGREAASGDSLEARVRDLELEVSSLVELVRGLLPRAADPTVTAVEIEAQMLDLDPVDRELYDRLRVARNALARALGISPYQLGQNRALRMIADMQSRALAGAAPRALDAADLVDQVPGMTPKTWGRVGSIYLAVLDRWARQRLALGDPPPFVVPP